MEQAVTSTVGKVVDSLFGLAIKEIGYMWNSAENVKTLKEEVDKLKTLKETLQQRINAARHEGKAPGKDLENWMENADIKISEATKLVPEEDESKKISCNLRFCVNLRNLRRYGKMATKESASLLKQQQDGEGFKNYVFDPLPTPEFIDLYQPKDLENIDTQKSTLKTIIQAVKDEQIVGIVGLGGVGKTTLANEAAAKMKSQFDYIEFIAVSQDVVVEKIKEKVQVAASRIQNGDRVLIILDDVWKELKLDEVGIPCGSRYKNCKILLTSRVKDVCKAMNANVIELNPLKEKEAWALFEQVVCEREWDATLKQIALGIVEECGGLPLFLQAVGNTLKGERIESWEAALNRLRAPISKDTEYKNKGILQLKLSYDYLKNKVAKSCFLLCSVFPEDADIDLERLTHYGVALGIFDDPEFSMRDAEHIVRGAIDTLKSSFLLLPVKIYEKNLLKMHDLVRDMAMVITSEGNDKFWVQSGKGLIEWQPKKQLENYKKISLMRNRIRKLPNHEIVFPQLDTFLIQNNVLSIVPDEFFQGMEKLKVLDMSYNLISSLPQSLKQLRELVMLDLRGNESLCEISILGNLRCLEILRLEHTGITNIPKEIGQLTNLRLLDVAFCFSLSYITPGVISNLIWLEELHLVMEGDCNILVELSELKSLQNLYLIVPNLDHIPEDFQYENLIEFHIMNSYYWNVKHHHKRMLHIEDLSPPFTMQVKKLIRLCEILSLHEINNLDNILPDLYQEGFDEVKYIDLCDCHNVRRLVNTCDLDALQISVTSNELGQRKTKGKLFSLVEEISLDSLRRLELLWDRPHKYISFCNLKSIEIRKCSSLIELFPVSVAQGLVSLRELNISECKSLVVIVSAEAEQRGGSEIELVNQDPDIMFPLVRVSLSNLPKLESFFSGRSFIKYPSLKLIEAYGCPGMKRWSYGDNHTPNIKFEHERRHYNNINDYIEIRHEEIEGWRITEEGFQEGDW